MALRWPSSDQAPPEGVRLFDVDPDLARGLSDPELAAASELVVPAFRASPGGWTPPERLGTGMGAVVLEGLLIATRRTFARDDVRLAGPGDPIDAGTLSDRDVAWRVLQPARLAVLDARFALAARRWPALLTALARRLFESAHEEHARAAICTMPRVEERILALLCHLALRWGHVTPDGVTLTLPVTHELLGALVGARRPTVSLALLALTEQRLVQRRDDGTWLLPADCRQWPTTGVPRTPPSIAS
jgi:CRP/FNR family transcriptional regulator, cyclic AMP receptor protein